MLSYAHGLSTAFELRGELAGHGGARRVVAVVGDGALTGGMAYEALNNLGHSGQRVVIVFNDNGRSLRADDLAAQPVADEPAPAPDLRLGARADPLAAAPGAGRRRGRLLGRRTA